MTGNEPEIEVDGPVIDDETGAEEFTARQGINEVVFTVTPVASEDGIDRWIMLVGPDRATPTDPGYEPYDTREEAIDAGKRASWSMLRGEA